MGLKKDLLRVSGSNLVVMLSSIVNGLILPYILSFDGFADLKTYMLYASFIGFLHLGFVDGINLKYGGKTLEDVDKTEFNDYHNFFISFQLIILIIVVLIGIISNNSIILLIGLAILPVNLQSFFLYYFQAIGKFTDYSKTTIVVPIINILLTLFFVFVGIVDYRIYIVSLIISYIISIALLEKKNKLGLNFSFVIKKKPFKILNKFKLFKSIFISGFFIMLGNILFTLFFDMGRWTSKLFTTNEGFAIYSLGVSLIGFVMVFISAINKTFYPYLYHKNNSELIYKYKNILYILGGFSLIGYFFLQVLIIKYLPKYEESLPLTAVLMTSIPGVLIIKSLYVNLYKVKKKEKKFLFETLIYLMISILLNVVLYHYFKSLISIAIASVASIYIWVIFPLSCIKVNRNIVAKEILYLAIIFSLFWFVYSIEYNIVLKTLIFSFFVVALNLIFFKRLILNILNIRA